MIRYALKCRRGHPFDAWFASADAFDVMCKGAQIACPDCGATDVEKALMAPGVSAGDAKPPSPPSPSPSNLARLRAEIERKADYVGSDFTARARAMHEGAENQRPIYGEAALPELRGLIDDGVPIAPLPFTPRAKLN